MPNKRLLITASFATFLACIAPASAAELVLNFRGGKLDRSLVRFESREASETVTPEEEGLRWHYIPGKTPSKPLGVAWHHQVRGNFVATAQYEILQIEPPSKGNGVGVELYLMLNNDVKPGLARDGLPFSRLVRVNGGPTMSVQMVTNNAEGRRISLQGKVTPTTAASERGRLRLQRQGETLIASFAEGDAEQFQEFHRLDIGTLDIRMVRFAGISGGDPNASMDMRLLEFRLVAEEFGQQGIFTKSPPGVVAQDGDGQAALPVVGPPAPTHRWLIWGAIVGGVIVVAGLLAFLTRKRHASMPPTPSAPAAMFALACAACGKNLKVKEELAGKRVKCPGCGTSVQVPDAVE